jgi:hypothetical protein
VTTAAATAPKRPIAVTIVAGLALLGGIYYLVSGGVALADARDGDDDRLFEGIVEILFGVFALAISLGAIGMRRWAWQSYMTWAVIGLTLQILRHFFYDGANYIGMAVNTFAVFALTPRDVQIAFGVRPPDNVDLTASTRNPIDRD